MCSLHGAWADGSSWSKVIPLLEAKGLHVVAVQLPLTSQADDVATVQRAIALVDGRLLLVAHSYGGAVMTQAGNDPKVAGLVYVAAFAPAEGESPSGLTNDHPTPFLQYLEPDQFGFLKLSATGIRKDLRARTCPRPSRPCSRPPRVQRLWPPPERANFHTSLAQQALFVRDRRPRSRRCAGAPGDVRGADERQSITLSSSHVAMLSEPYVVASFIRRAARDVQ